MYRISESEELELEKTAERKGMQTHFMVSAIAVKTKRGTWHLVPAAANCWKLRHENSRCLTYESQSVLNQFHRQKRNFPNFSEALEYIAVHDSLDRPIHWK